MLGIPQRSCVMCPENLFIHRCIGAAMPVLLVLEVQSEAPCSTGKHSHLCSFLSPDEICLRRDAFLLSSVNEARQLVDSAYKDTRGRIKKNLENDALNPIDLLRYFKQPVAGTRVIRAADYMGTTPTLLEEKLLGSFWDKDGYITPKPSLMSPIFCCPFICWCRRNPLPGASNRALARRLPADYEDGVLIPHGWTERKCSFGYPFPLMSNKIVHFSPGQLKLDQQRSLTFMQWDHFIDHDQDFSPESPSRVTFSGEVHCYTSSAKLPPCFPIQIPPDDPRIKNTRDCIPFFHSAPACDSSRATGEQINAPTSFFDGSEQPVVSRLRNRNNQLGLLAVNQNFTDKGMAYLPFARMPCLKISREAKIPCFFAASEMLELVCMHILFVQEHNRLARGLKRLNPHWNGEKLYQEARKTVGAMIQIITYRDYLPLLQGRNLWRRIPSYKGYKEWVDPHISNVFTLASRFAHASVPPFVGRLNRNYEPTYPKVQLSNFGVCHIVKGGGINPFLWNLIASRAKLMAQNQMMVDKLWDRLSEQIERIGLDLALNMQHDRDHGYVFWRKFCGLPQPCDVKSLGRVLKNDRLAKKFMRLCGTPRNSDIWVGAPAEPFVDGGRVGPLIDCPTGTQNVQCLLMWCQEEKNLLCHSLCFLQVLVEEQRGFHFPAALFTGQNLRIICDNTCISKVSRNIFQANRHPDSFVSCSRIPKLDLRAWKSKWMEESASINATS
uniref:Eosinophil peroxidase n=1 Tax=Phasianus colchicus TaxID=9054 RepID=A0A669P8L2_PHACC